MANLNSLCTGTPIRWDALIPGNTYDVQEPNGRKHRGEYVGMNVGHTDIKYRIADHAVGRTIDLPDDAKFFMLPATAR